VRRPDGRFRLLAQLGPPDARDLEALAAAVAPRLEAVLPPCSPANRVAGLAPLRLEPWTAARARHRALLRRLLEDPGVRAVLVLDVADCYGSIRPAALAAALRGLGLPGPARRAAGLLSSLQERGVPGLPVGPPASAVLANAVLLGLDAALRGADVPHVRWVDDVLVPTGDARAAARALGVAARALEGAGLVPHPGKTRVLPAPEEVRALLRRPASAAAR
ncbi:MAG TPA: reverse transcriptase domain-containing protein, partial [Actinomycetota bacterium]|nr:reverse transcriptase domain-containing protein [Actinomycetota bacterium]